MTNRPPRFPTNFPVVLRKGPEMFPATLCNVSVSGGCIISGNGMAKGETAVIDYELGQTRATVVWAIGNMNGLQFENQLSKIGLNSIRAMKVPA